MSESEYRKEVLIIALKEFQWRVSWCKTKDPKIYGTSVSLYSGYVKALELLLDQSDLLEQNEWNKKKIEWVKAVCQQQVIDAAEDQEHMKYSQGYIDASKRILAILEESK